MLFHEEHKHLLKQTRRESGQVPFKYTSFTSYSCCWSNQSNTGNMSHDLSLRPITGYTVAMPSLASVLKGAMTSLNRSYWPIADPSGFHFFMAIVAQQTTENQWRASGQCEQGIGLQIELPPACSSRCHWSIDNPQSMGTKWLKAKASYKGSNQC